MYFSYDHLEFRYEPFPIGLAKPIMEEGLYQQLLATYPAVELFEKISKLGDKYSLSERFNRPVYENFIRGQPVWREFHAWIKSDAFVDQLMQALREHNLDLGYEGMISPLQSVVQFAKDLRRGRRGARLGRLQTRFEFSMLPADGGNILPHTDAPSKVVTLIISMVGEGEWNPAFGGGTDVNWPKDSRLIYNELNRQAEFADVEVLDTYEFTPNQAVIFIKTFNSWHSVRPMTGQGSTAMRKTLTINIEAVGG